MADVNHVILIGHLTKDIGSDERSFGYASNGQARANVSLAVNRNRKNGDQWIEETSYFDITIWGKTAENLKPYLTKGKQIAVDGYLKQDRWEKDGQKFSKVGIVANTVQLLGGKSDGNSSSGNAPRFQPRNDSAKTNSSYSDNYSPDSFGGTGNDFPEDIPF
ncbi:MAG: single-stranded DNA-binding protein [Treponema sp.]|jgi:single-strand DNA-binding protein|nr:single-stranded DNA-binding protein [Treponema sp.]